MNKQIKHVETFHKTFGQPVLDKPTIPAPERCDLRYKLIEEELKEFKEAYEANDIVGVADALTDLLYVVLGSHIEFGLANAAEDLFEEVQKSNMSKLDENGNVIYKPNGKVAKSNLFKEPDLKSIVEKHTDLVPTSPYLKVDGSLMAAQLVAPKNGLNLLVGESIKFYDSNKKTLMELSTDGDLKVYGDIISGYNFESGQ